MEKFIRNCPMCGKEIIYANKYNKRSAIKLGTKCRNCTQQNKDNSKSQSAEFRKKMSDITSGGKSAMCGRTVYSIWLEKDGREIADQKMNEMRKKHSNNNKGSGNPMYGKPSPNGSGNGWSGWYKEFFFKSLKELSCIITYENLGYNLINAEREHQIKYIDWNGTERNYHPDYFEPITKTLIECKPKHLWNSANVLCKKKYAEEYCKLHELNYELVDPPRLGDEVIIKMHDDKEIKFIDRYEFKFQEKYKK